MESAAQSLSPVSLELGGNGPLVVFEDADLDEAVEGALAAKYRNTGQSCIAANRIFVHEQVAEEFTEEFVEATRQMNVGPGIEGGMDVGPMVNEEGLEKALRYIEQAVEEGAEVLHGGNRLTDGAYDSGFFLEPTVLGNVHDDMSCMQEEVFAPIAPITTFGSFDEAIERANDTIHGLSAYAFTSELSKAIRAGEELEAGTIGVNDGVPSTTSCPFGGMKQSGIGRELGKEGMEAFLSTKHMSLGI